jgi:NAD(P)-dependent dehydrogenase (short-subunit alcohol dehydrogenase family)
MADRGPRSPFRIEGSPVPGTLLPPMAGGTRVTSEPNHGHDAVTHARTVVVVGVGEGLGSSVARRFAAAGDRVGLIARSGEYLESLASDIDASTPGDAVSAPADVTDPAAVAAAFETIRGAFGPIDVLVSCLYSTETDSGGIREIDRDAFAGAWRVETAGVFSCVKAAIPDMVGDDGDGGTILLTTSRTSKRGRADSVARSSARFALRGLAESLAQDLAPDVHVALGVIGGWLATPALRDAHPDRPDDAWMDPDHVADAYHSLVEQPADARTFELDLRSSRDGLDGAWPTE